MCVDVGVQGHHDGSAFLQWLLCVQTLSDPHSQTLTNSFKQFDTNRNGWIQLTYEQFLTLVFSLKA